MKVSYTIDEYRRTVLSAEAGEYDGFPALHSLSTDAVPNRVNKFRQSVATALPFILSTNGALETQTPLFPLSAETLRSLCPLDILPTNVDWKPADVPTGTGKLALATASDLQQATRQLGLVQRDDDAALVFVPSDVFSGTLSTTRSCLASSNLWLVEQLEGPDRHLLSIIAFGVMFAEDFDAHVLHLKSRHEFKQVEQVRLERVLESVGLRLEMERTND